MFNKEVPAKKPVLFVSSIRKNSFFDRSFGAIAQIYQLFLSRAYRHAKAVKVGSLLYSSVAFAYLFDFFLGKKDLPLIVLGGMALIIVGSILALREQKQL